MKKYLIYATALLFSGPVLSSCKDFLTYDSPSSVTDEKVFNSESEALTAILGIYAGMTNNVSYGLRLTLYYNMNSDIDFGDGTGSIGNDDRYGLWDYTCTSNNSSLMAPWNYLYSSINRANECVEGIENAALFQSASATEPSMIRQLYGEAKALRAMFYLDLVRHWGDVPFKLEPTRAGDNFYLEISDRDSILTTLIYDLIDAEPTMMWAGELEGTCERMNRGAVQGLIARMALTRAGWALRANYGNPADLGTIERSDDYREYYQIARDYAYKLYESGKHNLSLDYATVFKNQCQQIAPSSDDMLFEIGFTLNLNGYVGYRTGMKIEGGEWGEGAPWTRFSLPYQFSFDTKDVRRDLTCAITGWKWNTQAKRYEQTIVAADKPHIGKWSKMWMNAPMGEGSIQNTGINWPVLRYADVLLMLAEAENEINGGPTELARTALKTVRKRAFSETERAAKVEDYVDNIGTYDEFFQAIVNERAWEFGGEGVRKYDLIRWNLLQAKFLELRQAMIDIGTVTRFPAEATSDQTAKYGHISPSLWYKMNADGTLDIQGLNSKITTAPSGYTEQQWALRLAEKSSGQIVLWAQLERCWRKDVVEATPFVYLFPIHREIIADSQGSLRNYYGKQ